MGRLKTANHFKICFEYLGVQDHDIITDIAEIRNKTLKSGRDDITGLRKHGKPSVGDQ